MGKSIEPRFFRSAKELRAWLKANHLSAASLWVGLNKKSYGECGLTQKEAVDQALCFGWIFSLIRSLDHATYAVHLIPRKIGGGWSAGTVKRFKELRKEGLVHASGIKAFESRSKTVYETSKPAFSAAHEKRFRANKKAWAFFSKQSSSYQNHVKLWVLSAKREETQTKRLAMLIEDSANDSKLKRILDATAKAKRVYPQGETPIEEARNLGPKTGMEMRSLGIDTVERLKSLGWERAVIRLCEAYPERVNLNAIKAVIGAVEDQDWRKLDPELLAEARALHRELKSAG